MSKIVSKKVLKKIHIKAKFDSIRASIYDIINEELICAATSELDEISWTITKMYIIWNEKFDEYNRNILKDNWSEIMQPIIEDIKKEYECTLSVDGDIIMHLDFKSYT